MRAGLATALLILLGCDAGDGGLYVHVRTDLLAGIEFSAVRTRLSRPAIEEVTAAFAGDPYLDGRRVAAFDSVPPGDLQLDVAVLRPDGTAALARPVRVAHSSTDTTITVVLTRGCRGAVCPGPGDAPDATVCLGSRCVPEGCADGTGAECPAPECARDSDCPAPAAACATSRCTGGVCLAVGGVVAGCDGICDPERGCSGSEADAAPPALPDAGPADAGPADAGPADAGSPDAAALADAGGTDGGVPDADVSVPDVTMDGSWWGTWSGSESGTWSSDLMQSGTAVSGSFTLEGTACLGGSGAVVGTYEGGTVDMTATSGAVRLRIVARASRATLNGTWSFETGTCSGVTGTLFGRRR
jgi:hypothetical protein